MAIFALPDTPSESKKQKLLKIRRWLRVILIPLWLIASYLYFNSGPQTVGAYRVLWIGAFVILVNLWNPFNRKRYADLAIAFRVDSIEITQDGLTLNGMTWKKFFSWNEVLRIEEPSNDRGLYVRTRNRLVWYVIPRRTEGYEEMKTEFAREGFPIVQTSAPWNWGFLFVFLFCSSLICDVLTQDRRILTVNLGLALVLGAAGLILKKYYAMDGRFRIHVIVGSFLPAALAAVSLILPLGQK